MTLKEIASTADINLHTLTNRIYKYGMTAEDAAAIPVKKSAKRRFVEVYERRDGVTT